MNSTAVMDRYYLQRVIIYIRHLMLSQQRGAKKKTQHTCSDENHRRTKKKSKKKKATYLCSRHEMFSSNIGPIPSSKRLSPS